jgi:hypothetical protein
MFTEDYLMRMINQAIAALLAAVGLRKAGKHREARQSIDQAVEWLTALPAHLVDQMDEEGVLSMLTAQEKLDVGRLAVLADLFWEQGEIQLQLGETPEGTASCARALRFTLEAALADEQGISLDGVNKIEARRLALEEAQLPTETQLAIRDYFHRLLESDRLLAAAGIRRESIAAALEDLQIRLGSPPDQARG